MITKEILESFCDKQREPMETPFNEGEYTYATDGMIAVRVDKVNGYPSSTLMVPVETTIKFHRYPDDMYTEIPDVVAENLPCQKCNGTGTTHKCPDCDGRGDIYFNSDSGIEYEIRCRLCRGTGTHKNDTNKTTCDECDGEKTIQAVTPFEIDGCWFDAHQLKRLKQLPGVKISPKAYRLENKQYAPVPICFDGGVGVVMMIKLTKKIQAEV